VATPIFDDHSGFLQRIENLAVEKFVAKLVQNWIRAVGRQPGSPWENGYCESFNSNALATNSGPYAPRAIMQAIVAS
jgi:hypothetical protein